MSTIEDRLTAALNARADLVQLEDLRPAEPPVNVVPFRRRPTTWLLAAAACALMVGVPLLALGGGDGDDRPVGPSTEAPTARPTPRNDADGADWPKVNSFDMYDVDGDGRNDKVVTRTESGEDSTNDPWRVEVHFTSGGIASSLVSPQGGWEVNPTGDVADVDGDGADEIVYYNGRDSESNEVGVLQYGDDGNLYDFSVPTDPGITSQADEQGRQRAWLVDSEQRLVSLRSVEGGYVPGSETNPLGERFQVDSWTWNIEDGALVAHPAGKKCVLGARMKLPFPCSQDGPTPPPGTFPEATDSRGIAEPFEADVDGDGVEDTIALEGPAGRTDTIEDGEVELYVTIGDGGGEFHAPVPAGWVPQVFTTPYVGPDNQRGLLLEQEGGDATRMTLYVLVGDELVVAGVDDTYFFGNGFDGPDFDQRTETWLSEDGALWMRRTPMAEQDFDDWDFYEWLPAGDRGIVAHPYGSGCWDC